MYHVDVFIFTTIELYTYLVNKRKLDVGDAILMEYFPSRMGIQRKLFISLSHEHNSIIH